MIYVTDTWQNRNYVNYGIKHATEDKITFYNILHIEPFREHATNSIQYDPQMCSIFIPQIEDTRFIIKMGGSFIGNMGKYKGYFKRHAWNKTDSSSVRGNKENKANTAEGVAHKTLVRVLEGNKHTILSDLIEVVYAKDGTYVIKEKSSGGVYIAHLILHIKGSRIKVLGQAIINRGSGGECQIILDIDPKRSVPSFIKEIELVLKLMYT